MERHEASAADLHQDKDIEDPKAHPHQDEEVRATIAWAGVRTKVIQRWEGSAGRRPPFGSSGSICRIVRGET
jgi:hypothetical protein